MAKYRYRMVKLPDSSWGDTATLAGVDHRRAFQNETLLDALDDAGWEVVTSATYDNDEIVVILRRDMKLGEGAF